MSEREGIAAGLAAAALDGEWTRPELLDRCASALGARPRWLFRLVDRMLGEFAEPPRAQERVLSRFVAANRSFARASQAFGARVQIRRFHLPVARMATRRWPVPAIETRRDLAVWLGVTGDDLDWLADGKGLLRHAGSQPALQHYRCLWLPKPSGGFRLLERPKARLKLIQRRILHEILDGIPAHDAAHGFVRGRSVRTFVAPHAGRSVVLRLDLSDFFASLSATRVRAVFAAAGYPDAVAHALASLTTTRATRAVLRSAPPELTFAARQRLSQPHLPQGAPTSPALANLCALGLDLRLAALAARAGARYTRYADDLAFSGERAFAGGLTRFEPLAGAIAREEGFSLNHRKTRVMPSGGRQRIAGVVVNRHPNIARADFDRLKAILTNCARHGAASQNRGGVASFRAHLAGRVSWVEQLNPDRGRRLRDLLDRIDWTES